MKPTTTHPLIRYNNFRKDEDFHKLRGKWIVVEGPDRIGKTTLISVMTQALSKANLKVLSNGFPRRETYVGEIIDKTLKSKNDYKIISGKAQTMLFLADMMDAMNSIKNFLKNDGVVLSDRYTMSTYAYALAQYDDIDEEWIRDAISLLPTPDLYILLTPYSNSVKYLTRRDFYGQENTETVQIQEKVLKNMLKFKENNDKVINIKLQDKEYILPEFTFNSFILPSVLDYF
jgi:dTMP kinase